jgi:glycosyltransferase involved in cell wall biosynthesis
MSRSPDDIRAEAQRPPAAARVLHVLKYYRPAFTGEGVFLERSSAVMQEIAPDVAHDLLVTHTPAPAEAGDGAACSTLSRVHYLLRRDSGAVLRHLALAWWMLRNVRRYDTVHVRTHADWYFVSYLIARIAGARLVLSATLDDSLPVLVRQYRPGLRALAARGFRLFDAHVAISPRLAQETRSALADPADCHLIPCGITVPPLPQGTRARMRAELGVGDADTVLLFVGGLCARKDPLFLVEAMPRLLAQHPRMRLVLVGPPLESDHVALLQERIARLGLGQAVSMVGEQLDPHPWFAAADILVFASRLEGFGTVVPEAMAHGLPVVVRHLPGVNDTFVREGETGHLFDDEDGYVAAVAALAGAPARRRALGAAGRTLATTQFGMRGVAARMLGVYGLGASVRAELAQLPESGLGCTASVLDQRFHSPAPPPPGPGPLLVTTVDAEEAFEWSRPFSRTALDVSSMAAQVIAHRVFARHGVVPVYLVDYAVAAQEDGRAPLRDLLADGACEIGAQLHPWVTPPFIEEVNERNSYAGNLPAMLEYEKARRLTEILGESFGTAPRIYRTGRYGVGARTADILKRLGYLADSSLAPCWPTPLQGRPREAWALSARPHWVDRQRELLEIPVSAALVGRLARQGPRVAPFVFSPLAERLGLPGAMSHFGALERIRLSPEGITIDEAKRLTRSMLADGHRVFVLTYHSPSLKPGNTPYVRTQRDLDRFVAWLDAYYAFFREEIGGRFGSWRDVHAAAGGTRPASQLRDLAA